MINIINTASEQGERTSFKENNFKKFCLKYVKNILADVFKGQLESQV